MNVVVCGVSTDAANYDYYYQYYCNSGSPDSGFTFSSHYFTCDFQKSICIFKHVGLCGDCTLKKL